MNKLSSVLLGLTVVGSTLLATASGWAEEAVVTEPAAEAAASENKAPMVGWIELNSALRESPLPFAWVTEDDLGDSLKSVLDRIYTVRDDADYAGLVIFLDQPSLTLPQCTAIADAIRSARDKGKTVMTFAEVYDLRDYLIASAADSVLLQKKGSVELTGIAVEEMYLAGMFEKVGVKPDLLQVGKYKGADETFMRSRPSEAWDENFDTLLDDLYGQSIRRIMDGRGLTEGEVEALFKNSWAMKDTDLLAKRAVDQLVDRDLIDVTEVAFGESFEWDTEFGKTGSSVDPNNPFALFSMLFQEPKLNTTRPTIAVIHADGPINSGKSSIGDGLFSSDSIGSRTVIGALEDALYDENIRGVVLRIDSPGGSALASEVIWQAVREFGREKPIFAVVGSMAASGGYYIVSGTDQIYVQPHSILGSIGVVGGKITLGGLYDWAGVNIVRRSRGPGGDLFNSVEPFNEEQRETVRAALTMIYDQFVERVETGRGDRVPEVGEIAEGRLFTGAQSVENGMADRVGGVDEAVADLAAQLELSPGGYDVVDLPKPMSLNEYFSTLFGGQMSAPPTLASPEAPAFLATAKQLLGPAAWKSVSRSMRGMMMLQHEPVLLMMPTAIVVK
ncbi:MAG: S49 family peptidase [Planctomycetota bacterium]